jgi:hypothetical protein
MEAAIIGIIDELLVLWLCILLREFGTKSDKYCGEMLFFIIFYLNASSLALRSILSNLIWNSITHKNRPIIIKHRLFNETNRVPPVTILAASICTFSILSTK